MSASASSYRDRHRQSRLAATTPRGAASPGACGVEPPRGRRDRRKRGRGDRAPRWIDGAAAVYLVDACVSGAPPGTIHRFDATAAPLPDLGSGLSTHGFGAPVAIELAARSTVCRRAASSMRSRAAHSTWARRSRRRSPKRWPKLCGACAQRSIWRGPGRAARCEASLMRPRPSKRVASCK